MVHLDNMAEMEDIYNGYRRNCRSIDLHDYPDNPHASGYLVRRKGKRMLDCIIFCMFAAAPVLFYLSAHAFHSWAKENLDWS